MVTEKNVSDLVIPNIDTEKFLGELVLNYPKLVGQIVSRKPEYGSTIEEIVKNHTVNKFTGGKGYEQGYKYLSMGLINKALECFKEYKFGNRVAKEYETLAKRYGKSGEWDYINPKKLTNSAVEEINNPYKRLDDHFSGRDQYAIFFKEFD